MGMHGGVCGNARRGLWECPEAIMLATAAKAWNDVRGLWECPEAIMPATAAKAWNARRGLWECRGGL